MTMPNAVTQPLTDGASTGAPPTGAAASVGASAHGASDSARGAVAAGPATLAQADAALDNLHKINHIVVLMLEGRSFDQVLGYLSLHGRADIDGLQPHFHNSHEGRQYAVHCVSDPCVAPAPAHDGAAVARQMAGCNGGFVHDYIQTHGASADPAHVMGYVDAQAVPVYDFLAQHYCVCDRWFSPVAGGGWPNRLYAVSGRACGSLDSKRVPLYSNKSVFRHLDRAYVSWKFYSSWQPWTLALTDDHYRASDHFEPIGTAARRHGFIGDARAGTLPALSWIDPPLHCGEDSVMASQALVAQVYQALAASPQWARTLLVITYDNHGGFYDHVVPGAARDADFQQQGPRVPALVAGAWVGSGRAFHGVLDHTAILKTILLRFCRTAQGDVPDMGKRVGAAAHLGALLDEPTARAPLPLPQDTLERVAAWTAAQAAAELTLAPGGQSASMALELAGAIAAEKQIARSLKHTAPGHATSAVSVKRRRKVATRGPSPSAFAAHAPPAMTGH